MKKFWASSQTANSAAPSGVPTDGVIDLTEFPGPADDYTILVESTAGSGTMTVTPVLWLGYEGYTDESDPSSLKRIWAPAGTGDASDKGKLNEGTALGETGANAIAHVERVYGMRDAKYAYLQITGIGGTATAIQGYLTRRGGAR